MKKMGVILVALAVVVLAGSAQAQFDLGKKLIKGGVASGINKELKQDKYTCTWNPTAKKVAGCKLNDIAAYLSAQRKSVEVAGSATVGYTDFEIDIHAKDYAAFEVVKKKLKEYGVGSWDINHKTDKVSGDEVKFTVAIQ